MKEKDTRPTILDWIRQNPGHTIKEIARLCKGDDGRTYAIGTVRVEIARLNDLGLIGPTWKAVT